MISQVHVYPPLGVLTSVRQKYICFRVYFVVRGQEQQQQQQEQEKYNDGAKEICETEIWTDMRGNADWEGISLERLPEDTSHGTNSELSLLDQAQLTHGHHIVCFGLAFPSTTPSARHFEFTVRWRKDSQSSWQWISELGQNARVVVYQNAPVSDLRPTLNHRRQQLRRLLLNENDAEQPLAPLADSWRSSNGISSCIFKPLGNAHTDGVLAFCRLSAVERYLAFVRKDKFWIIPRSGSGPLELNGFEIVILICELSTGAVVALMPFVKDDERAINVTFLATPRNRLCLSVTPPSLGTSNIGIRVAASISEDMHSAIEEVFHRIHRSVELYSSLEMLPPQNSPCSDKANVRISNTLGYCTWNTFYQQVSEDAIISALKDIKQASHSSNQPMPKWVMIDDGWQSVDSYDKFGKLYDIYGNDEKFPKQLKHTVAELAKIGIRRVGVWHALWGYWGGIDPSGPLAARYNVQKYHRKESLIAKHNSDVWLISAKDVSRFYDEFYAWLYSQGISFVKVDYQSAFETLAEYASASDIDSSSNDGDSAAADLYSAYYNAMESAAGKYFGAGCILYCMSHSPQLITRVLRRNQSTQSATQLGSCNPRSRMFIRNSDDYFPDVPESHGWHIYCNMANVIWSRMLGGYFAADWDMFKPGKYESTIHSVSRAVSGGLVYITGDKNDYIAQDLSQAAGHGSQILECNYPLIDSNSAFTDCTQFPSLLLASSASARNSSVLIYTYNVSISTVIAPIDVSQLYRSAKQHSNHDSAIQSAKSGSSLYVIHQHSTGRVIVTESLESIFTIALQSLACDILTVTPMSVFQSANRLALLYAACIGDTTRYGGVNAVERDISSVLPDSPRGPSPCLGDRSEPAERCTWNIRAKATLPSSTIAFVFSVQSAAGRSRDLSLSVTNVRVSGTALDRDCWNFDNSTKALHVRIPPQISSQNNESFARITVTLSCYNM